MLACTPMHDFPSTSKTMRSHLSANIGAMKRANPETTGRVVLFRNLLRQPQ